MEELLQFLAAREVLDRSFLAYNKDILAFERLRREPGDRMLSEDDTKEQPLRKCPRQGRVVEKRYRRHALPFEDRELVYYGLVGLLHFLLCQLGRAVVIGFHNRAAQHV